jgi:class 3 adenylate cyclase/DNA-binding transcriptional MerR regulator
MTSTPTTSLSTRELAKRAGTTPAWIRRLTEIGVLRPDERRRFRSGDLQRVQIVAAYEAGGIELDDIARAIRERRMSFEMTDRIYPEASPSSGRSVSDLATALGPGADLLPDLFMALGLPRPALDRPLTEADERVLPAFLAAWDTSSMSSDTTLRAARLLGDATRRAAEGWIDLFMEAVAPPPEESAVLTVDELAPRMFEPAIRVAQLFEPMAIWLLRRHMERALNAVNVEAMERALEVHGRRPRAPAEPPAVVFADLSGFTRLTEEHGDELAARHAEALSQLAIRAATTNDGRLVKQLGDGVMLVFRRVGQAVRAAFDLRAGADRAALPPLHVGISAGPMIERDGDYFGRTVNLASRISAVAGPGEILANQTAAEGDHDVPVVALGPTQLKGLSEALPLFRLEALPPSTSPCLAGR